MKENQNYENRRAKRLRASFFLLCLSVLSAMELLVLSVAALRVAKFKGSSENSRVWYISMPSHVRVGVLIPHSLCRKCHFKDLPTLFI